jgi:hypothetical protein
VTIKYRKNITGLAVLFYVFGAFYFSTGFNFTNQQITELSDLSATISFLVMLACVVEAIRNLLIYTLNPDRLTVTTDSVIIAGLLRKRVLNFNDISKVVIHLSEEADPFGLKKKMSIETAFGKTVNVNLFSLELDPEKFRKALKNNGLNVDTDN